MSHMVSNYGNVMKEEDIGSFSNALKGELLGRLLLRAQSK
jgi:hypothetical protein